MLTHRSFRSAAGALGVQGVAILSTCNRVELYLTASRPVGLDDGVGLFARACGADPREVTPFTYQHQDRDALRHLFAVAAGLESMVPGEVEILGQVGEARERAVRSSTIEPELDSAFEAALRAGRRARDETSFGRLPASVASEAVRQLALRLPDLADRSVAVVGTGQMARGVATVLAAKGVTDLRIVGRSRERAGQLAAASRGRSVPWADLGEVLRTADAAICTTAARLPVVTRELIERLLPARNGGRSLLLIDIALPRDVDPAVAALPGVEVRDLDHLQAQVEANLDERRRAIPQVERIIADEIERFEARRRGVELRPVLAGLHAWGEEVRRKELARAVHRLGPVAPDLHQQLEAFSSALVAKLLDPPSRRLRGVPDETHSGQLKDALRELFDLPVGRVQGPR